MSIRVKELCRQKGILFKDLAAAVGISDVALRKQMQGNPTVESLNRIAAVLGVETWELLTPSTAQSDFMALIKSKNDYYHASSLAELKGIVNEIEAKP